VTTRWQETQSPQLELLRHFCGQFFESEFVSRPGQLKLLFTGVLSILASLSVPFRQAYYHKYLMLKQMEDTQPFVLAMMADSWFLISLTMVVIGLLTAFLWQSLFPDRRDYLAIAALPLRMQDIFRAKFLALLGFITLSAVFLSVPLSIGLPAMMQPQRNTAHFAIFGLMGTHTFAIAVASIAAGLFVFFALVTLQGVLLNVLPLRSAARLSFVVQAILLIALLASIPAVIAIPRLTYSMNLRPSWATLVPPLWFLGLEQQLMGNRDPFAAELAWRAILGLAASAATALGAYWWSYRRHRIRVLESPGSPSRKTLALPEPALSPRSLSVFSFVAKTLGRSPQHRLILTAFAGIAVAISANGLAGSMLSGSMLTRSRAPLVTVLAAAHLALSLFILAGLQYLFRLPVEPRANWIFRIHEPGHTARLIFGVEAFYVYAGVIPVAALNLGLAIASIGFARGTLLTLLSTLPALHLIEILLFPTYKIPFTSLYLPARKLITETLIKYGVGLILYISILSTLLSWCTDSPVRAFPALALMTISYWRLRIIRLDTQRVGRIEFEELPDVVVQTINIHRD
jgi:hypothetical protein